MSSRNANRGSWTKLPWWFFFYSHDDIFGFKHPDNLTHNRFFFSASGSTHRSATRRARFRARVAGFKSRIHHLLVCSRAGHAIIFKSQHIYRLLRTCNQDWQKRISCSGGHGTSIYQQNCGIHWWRGSTILTMQRQSFDTRRQHLYSEQNKIIQHYRANSSIAQIGSKEKHLCYSISCYIGLFLKSFWWFPVQSSAGCCQHPAEFFARWLSTDLSCTHGIHWRNLNYISTLQHGQMNQE